MVHNNGAGTYVPEYERMRNNRYEGVERSARAETRTNNIRGCITRYLNIEDNSNIDDWNDFMNSFGAENRYLGQTRNPGNMGITYFTTNQIAGMFAEKYSRISERELRLKMYRASKFFNSFIRDNATETVAVRQEASADMHPDEHKKWLMGSFGISDILHPAPNSKKKYAFFLKPDAFRTIREEQNDIRRYWKAEGFKERYLQNVEPHITIVDLFQGIGTMAVNRSKMETPINISLLEPKMTVFELSTRD